MIYNSFGSPGLVKVLNFLQTHNTEYLSGQDLSDVLKISRVAVWKHIKKLKELGYSIESKQKLGYKLTKNSELLLPWEVTSGLKTRWIGQQSYYFDSTDSTQNQALKMARDSKNEGTVIIAGKQTGGRGRAGRKWISPSGGIWISVIIRPKLDISKITLFPIASSLALALAIEKIFKIYPELKWPNDITLKGKKLAGIIVDASLESNRIESLVLGIGINFDVNSKNIEKILKETSNFYGVASLSKYRKKIKPIQLVQTFLLELEKIYEQLDEGKIKKIISEWTKRSSTIGKIIEFETTNGKKTGTAIKIDEEGALWISTGDKNERIIAGDVIHR